TISSSSAVTRSRSARLDPVPTVGAKSRRKPTRFDTNCWRVARRRGRGCRARRAAGVPALLKFRDAPPISYPSLGWSRDASPFVCQDGRTAEGQLVLDLTMQAIQTSLDGLAARQRIEATNLANAETPGYTAQTVNFEDSLASAIAGGDPSQ